MKVKLKILVLCTGNSCRSQMAEGFLKSFSNDLYVVSAGTEPSNKVHPKAIEVMKEIGIDLSEGRPKSVNEFLNESFDYVILSQTLQAMMKPKDILSELLRIGSKAIVSF